MNKKLDLKNWNIIVWPSVQKSYSLGASGPPIVKEAFD